MKKWKTSLVLMTKTPAYSAVKTRLKSAIHPTLSSDFFQRATHAVMETLRSFWALDPLTTKLWLSVPEHRAMSLPYPENFHRIWQGDGNLGHRIHNTYSQILSESHCVIILGMDTPQVSLKSLQTAVARLTKTKTDVVIGPSADGGFYLFGGTKEIPSSVWTKNPWSSSSTYAELMNSLSKRDYIINHLQRLTDVDEFDDLNSLLSELKVMDNKNSSQQDLLQWTEELLSMDVLPHA